MTKSTQSKTDGLPIPLNEDTPKAGTTPTPTKRDIILALIARPHGASLDEMVVATGWLPHTTRAMLTVLKKKGHALTSDKVDGLRRYRIEAGAA